ncbi:MAG: C40 family peptidase [Cryomorphaceae bacterium]|nr:C40 family peptidase [Flavobacteriales bacterium]
MSQPIFKQARTPLTVDRTINSFESLDYRASIKMKSFQLPVFDVMASKNRMLEYAAQYASTVTSLIGKPYVRGANGPDKFDCSGAVCYGLRNSSNPGFGDYTAHDLYTKFSLPTKSVNAGDLIFYDYTGDGRIDHVVSVIKNRMIVHPSSGAKVIELRPINYLNNYTKSKGGNIFPTNINWNKITQ